MKAFSETDFTEDLAKFDVPTLIVHGDDDRPDRQFRLQVREARQRRTDDLLFRAGLRFRRNTRGRSIPTSLCSCAV